VTIGLLDTYPANLEELGNAGSRAAAAPPPARQAPVAALGQVDSGQRHLHDAVSRIRHVGHLQQCHRQHHVGNAGTGARRDLIQQQ
jgi:hypothetical protein